jgi:hypothetical protein
VYFKNDGLCPNCYRAYHNGGTNDVVEDEVKDDEPTTNIPNEETPQEDNPNTEIIPEEETSISDNTLDEEETIIAEENCDMAVLSNKLYSEQILSEKSVLLDQRISDLHENHFFREIKYGKFSKKYFKLFINEKYKKEDIIFNEGDEVKYLYFIQEGTVELSLNKSINEIEFLIDCLLDKKDIISEDSKSDLRLKDLMKGNYIFEEFLSQQNFNKNSNYIQLPNSNEEIDVNYLNEKQNNKLIILKNNEDFGIISLILGNKYIATNLTLKEHEVAKLTVFGFTTKEIAGMLYVSESSVKQTISRIISKTGLDDKTQFVYNI